MLSDARRDVDEARARLLAAVNQLPGLRGQLEAARETLLWVGSFPEQAESYGYPTALALRLRQPVESTLQSRAMSVLVICAGCGKEVRRLNRERLCGLCSYRASRGELRAPRRRRVRALLGWR